MEENEEYLLDKKKSLRGLKIFLDNSEGKICKLDSGYEVDPTNIDANDADSIIQYAIFGELVYA